MVKLTIYIIVDFAGKLVEFDEPKKLLNKEGSLFGMLVKEYWARTLK